MTQKTCLQCKKPTQPSRNFCSWECHVQHAKDSGAKQHTPNGLPVQCITASGFLLECEHGDHPTYLFPVEVQLKDEDYPEGPRSELYAVIYTDGRIAVTLHECTYEVWTLLDGTCLHGHSATMDGRITTKSIQCLMAYWEDHLKSLAQRAKGA